MSEQNLSQLNIFEFILRIVRLFAQKTRRNSQKEPDQAMQNYSTT